MSGTRVKIPASFLLGRLHTLAAAFLYALVLTQIFVFSSVLSQDGISHFGSIYRFFLDIPQFKILKVIFVWLPLSFTLMYGLAHATRSKPGVPTALSAALVSYWVERLFFGIAVAFIMAHVFFFRPSGDYLSWVRLFSRDPIFLMYLAGSGSVLYWLGRGFWHFLIDWGIVVSVTVQNWVWRVILTFVVLSFAVATLMMLKLKFHYEAPLPWIQFLLDAASKAF